MPKPIHLAERPSSMPNDPAAVAGQKEIGRRVAAADFVLADQVNLGEYTVSATVGDTVSERSVRVKRYTLPTFRIDLETDRGYYRPGQTVTGHLRAEYTFGKPVEGGRVRIVASEFIETFRPFATVDGETDGDGRFAFEIPLKQQFVGQQRKKGDAFVSLEATVRDTAGHEQTKTLDLTVTASPIHIEVVPESGRLVQGVENVVYVVTAYPDGRPARTRLTLGATREVAETNALGIAKVKIVPESESLQLTVAAEDAQGRRAVEAIALPAGPDNHWFDCVVGCAVGASMEGASLPGEESRAARQRVRLSDLQRSKR